MTDQNQDTVFYNILCYKKCSCQGYYSVNTVEIFLYIYIYKYIYFSNCPKAKLVQPD